jgi:RNA polymerase sigma-70 factor, ECF subfamily
MLVNAYSKKVFNLAYQFSGSRQEAEDRTQEIFLKLYGALGKYDFSRNFTAWLLTLAKNHLIDEYRRTRWERTLRDDLDERTMTQAAFDGPERNLAREEDKRTVWKALDGLSPEIRATVILRDIQGLTYEEIAGNLGLPLGTIKSRVNRGRLQLAAILRPGKAGIGGGA